MALIPRALETARKWFSRRDDEEPSFPIPDLAKDNDYVPPAVKRHLEVIRDAMIRNDLKEVGNRQRRLAKLGHQVPTKLSHVDDLLKVYSDAT